MNDDLDSEINKFSNICSAVVLAWLAFLYCFIQEGPVSDNLQVFINDYIVTIYREEK
jgi:hypothetical protein